MSRYVTGRKRVAGQINGKSANLNHCLKTVVFPGCEAASIPSSDVVVVFDADMVAHRSFLRKVCSTLLWGNHHGVGFCSSNPCC